MRRQFCLQVEGLLVYVDLSCRRSSNIMTKDNCIVLDHDRGISYSRRERSSSHFEMMGNDSGSTRAIYVYANVIFADEPRYTVSVLGLWVVIEPPNEKERAAPEGLKTKSVPLSPLVLPWSHSLALTLDEILCTGILVKKKGSSIIHTIGIN